ncbi:MAG: winged helix-turn-helix domain-containing protein [Sphaerotilus sp.]|nr:winged helix-turn-helix domain-containing protein [Sphaerotilus sp.]
MTPATPGGLANILAATRMLLGAWDATLNQWGSPAPSPGPVLTPEQALEEQATRRAAPPASNGADATLSVQMLDGLQVWVGSAQVLDLPRGKARALLMYLLLHRRRPTSRARLCSLFWPDADPASARNNLNVILHRVRRQLHDPGLLLHTDDGYQIATAVDAWIDVEQFEQQASLGEQADTAGLTAQAIAHYEVAATLYRTDLVDESEHERVLIAHSQLLRDRLNQVVERLSGLREDRCDLHGCLRTTQRHLGLDECNEAAHRRLMRCYARLGQPQLAERQYRQCRTTLHRQLGLNPDAETTELYRRITRREAV